MFLIFEPYDGDSLDHVIEQGKCDLQTALKYFVEILLGIQHMHSFGFFNLNILSKILNVFFPLIRIIPIPPIPRCRRN